MKSKYQGTVGQAIVTCTAVNANAVELEFTWVQDGKGFGDLIGRCPEYINSFWGSKIRLGNGVNEHPVHFEWTRQKEAMKSGHEYAVLIAYDSKNPDSVLQIKNFGSKKDFERVREQAARGIYIHSDKKLEPVTKKKRRHFEVVVDLTRYRVTAFGNQTFAGTSTEIVNHFVREWECDPLANLASAEWQKKVGDRYQPCPAPNIPAPNQMLLSAFARDHQTMATLLVAEGGLDKVG